MRWRETPPGGFRTPDALNRAKRRTLHAGPCGRVACPDTRTPSEPGHLRKQPGLRQVAGHRRRVVGAQRAGAWPWYAQTQTAAPRTMPSQGPPVVLWLRNSRLLPASLHADGGRGQKRIPLVFPTTQPSPGRFPKALKCGVAHSLPQGGEPPLKRPRISSPLAALLDEGFQHTSLGYGSLAAEPFQRNRLVRKTDDALALQPFPMFRYIARMRGLKPREYLAGLYHQHSFPRPGFVQVRPKMLSQLGDGCAFHT